MAMSDLPGDRHPLRDDNGADPAVVLHALGQVIYHGTRFTDAHQAVCQAAQLTVDGCHHASIMVHTRTGPVTAAASDATAAQVDRLERAVGTGPCVDALTDQRPQLDAHLAAGAGPWPALATRVLAQTPVRGMLGFRIAPQGRKLGALNLFTDTAGGFTDTAVNQGAILAAFCSLALTAAEAGQQATTLKDGLDSNRQIGMAIGLLMAHHRIDDQAAFALLRQVSSELNLKLRDVAAQVLSGHRDQLPPT